MSYTINYSIGTITVVDSALNSQTSLNLPGRNYAGYGRPIDENQISLLENFASYPNTGPSNPIPGQTWYDSATAKLKVNVSTTLTPNWQNVGAGAAGSDTQVQYNSSGTFASSPGLVFNSSSNTLTVSNTVSTGHVFADTANVIVLNASGNINALAEAVNTNYVSANSATIAGNVQINTNLGVSGNITTAKISTNNYCYANGAPVSFGGGGGGGGVTQIIAGANVTISPSGGTGVVTINATGGGGTGGFTVNQNVGTSDSPSFTGLTITTTAGLTMRSGAPVTLYNSTNTNRWYTNNNSGVYSFAYEGNYKTYLDSAGNFSTIGDVTAYYSDDRLKTKLGDISNALDIVCGWSGFYYQANETAQALGYVVKREVGLSAQTVQKDAPEIVHPAPIDNQYLTINYERSVPYLVEAIKALRKEIAELKGL